MQQHETEPMVEGFNEARMAKTSSRTLLIAVGVVVVVAGLLIAVIVLATRGTTTTNQVMPGTQTVAHCDVINDPSSVFGDVDGISIRWRPNVAGLVSLEEVKEGVHRIIEINVTLSPGGGDPTVSGSQWTLDQLMTSLETVSKGVKINIQSNEEADKVAASLIRTGFTGPVVLSVPVMKQRAGGFTWSGFKTLLTNGQLKHKKMVVSFDMRDRCCTEPLGIGVFEYIRNLMAGDNNHSFALELAVESLSQSYWAALKPQLDAAPLLNLLIHSGNDVTDIRAHAFKLLRVRNDMDGHRVWYNIGDKLYTELKAQSYVGGSPMLYFKIRPRDASEIIWSHNTDTWEQLNAATQGPTMMVEGDIMLKGQGTPEQTNIPIMAHDKGDDNNLTFEQWLNEIIEVDKGMKFDFKYMDAVKPALDITSWKHSLIRGPIWLNADILQGPDGPQPRFEPKTFLAAVSVLPGAMLSLGWTTIQKGDNYHLNYTMDMVREMFDVCKNLSGPVTFPVRAEQFRESLDSFDWLLRQSRDYTLTIWTGHGDNVTKADMDFAKERFDSSRVYFDLTDDLRPSFGL